MCGQNNCYQCQNDEGKEKNVEVKCCYDQIFLQFDVREGYEGYCYQICGDEGDVKVLQIVWNVGIFQFFMYICYCGDCQCLVKVRREVIGYGFFKVIVMFDYE